MSDASIDPFAMLDEPAPPATLEPHPEPQPTKAKRVAHKSPPTIRPASSKSIIYFDLETIPDYGREEFFDLPPLPEPAEYLAENDSPAPSELIAGTEADVKEKIAKALAAADGKKLPRCILEACAKMERSATKPRKGVIGIFESMIRDIQSEGQLIAEAAAARIKEMSVCPEMCQIVAFGWAVGDEEIRSMVTDEKPATSDVVTTEADILRTFWDLVANGAQVCGYNILSFDLPVIFVRSAILGIKPSRQFDLKPWGRDCIDLMALRYPKAKAAKLEWLAGVNGVQSEVPDVDGSKVCGLMQAGDLVTVGNYVRDDVHLARSLHQKYRGFFW